MAIGENAGILFRIKADSSQAEGELRKMLAQTAGLGEGFAGMAGPAGIAAAAIAAIGTAAVTAAVALTKLAFDASEYGSTIFDAKEKTGLAAETLSTLRVAADASGSSFEGVSASVSKFAVLVGQANQRNEKAAATLNQYGIKSRDLKTALEEAVSAIGREKDETLQAAAAKDLFKDRTGAIIPVIKQLGGDLRKATEDAKRLGLTLSDEDVKAADDLGDAFGVLSAQVKAGAARFALQYAPQITAAIQKVGEFLAANQDRWAEWGRFVYNTITGTAAVLEVFGKGATDVLAGITLGLSNQIGAWKIWSAAARIAIGIVTGGLSEIVMMLAKVGEMINGGSAEATGSLSGDPRILTQPKMPKMPKMPKISGGGGGGGGGSSADNAEQQRRKEVEENERINARLLASYRALLGQEKAEFTFARTQNLIVEEKYVKAVGELKLKELIYEQQLNDQLLKDARLNADERTEIEARQEIIAREIGTARIEIANDVYEAIKKKVEKETDDFRRAEEEKERIRKDKAEQRKRQEQQDADDRLKRFHDLQDREKAAGLDASGFGQGLINAIDLMVDKTLNARDRMAAALNGIKASWQSMGNIATGALSMFAEGIGNIVQNLVLMSDAGPHAMRKLVASVLAGVAAQAAVLAIFELAKGFAALFFNPAEANAHFIAAALFGSIALVTGLAGRAVAGNSFKQASGGGTGATRGSGGSATSNGSDQQNNYTTRFNGYMSGQNAIMGRINETLGALEEAVHGFTKKFGPVTPGDVVMAGAGAASSEIAAAYNSELGNDTGVTDKFMRNAGFAR